MLNSRWTNVSKILLTAIIYFLTSKLGDIFTFIHAQTNTPIQAFWPPSGIAFGLLILLGRSAWPGILLGSLIRTPLVPSVIGDNAEIMNTFIVSSTVAAGRVIEPLIGYALIRKYITDGNYFNNLFNAFRFILITLFISVIGSGISASIIQVFRQDEISVYVSRLVSWYFNNVFGILLFTPFLISAYQVTRLTAKARRIILIQSTIIILAIGFVFYFQSIEYTFNPVLIRTVFLAAVPLVIWVAFQYHLVVSSLTVMAVSILTVYFSARDINPFMNNLDGSDLTILFKLFFVTCSFTTILTAAAASERKAHVQQADEHARALTNSNAELLGVLEDLQLAKEKAEQSDRLKSSFLANISHEIRNPMNAIVGFSELLNHHHLSTKKREQFPSLIRQRSKDLLAIINDVIDISKIESREIVSMPAEGNIQEMMHEVMRNFSAELNHLHHKSIEAKMYNELKGAENVVVADFARLQQVFNNLLHNALKFTEKGSIEMGCKFQDENTLLFYVRDTGIGIDPSKHELIFRRFQQATSEIHYQYGGTGLGLAIIKGLVNLWNGEIWVESEIGKGSTFFFTLPYHSPTKTQV